MRNPPELVKGTRIWLGDFCVDVFRRANGISVATITERGWRRGTRSWLSESIRATPCRRARIFNACKR